MPNKSTLSYLLGTCISFATCGVLAEAPYDPTFAFGTPYSYPFDSNNTFPVAIARDKDGHLITALSDGNKQAVSRHNGPFDPTLIISPGDFEGTLDQSFGRNGIATDFFADGRSDARAIAIDHHNRIVMAGTVAGTATCNDGSAQNVTALTLVRLKNAGDSSDGQADWTFGSFGVAFYGADCDSRTDGLANIAIDVNDNVVAVGSVLESGRSQAALVRWTVDGNIDATFGRGGVMSINSGSEESSGAAVTFDTDQRIIAVAQTLNAGSKAGVVARYDTDGNLDTKFGSGGFVQLPDIDTYGYICCVAVDGQNRILVAGTTSNDLASDSYRTTIFIAKLTEGGVLDSSFGSHGVAYLASGSMTEIGGLALDARGRPIVVGSASSSYLPYSPATTFHLNLDGTLNTAVGFAGMYSTSLGFSSAFATDVLVDPLGRPTLTVEASDSDGRFVPVLIRYDELFGDGFD